MAAYDNTIYANVMQQCTLVSTNVVSALRELLTITNYCECPSYGESLLVNAKRDLEFLKIRFDELTSLESCNNYPHPYFDVLDSCRSRTDSALSNASLLLNINFCCEANRICEFAAISSKLFSEVTIIKADCYLLDRYVQIGGCN